MLKTLLPLVAVTSFLVLGSDAPARAQNVGVSVTLSATSKTLSDGSLAWVVDPRATLTSARIDVSAVEPALADRCGQETLRAVEREKLLQILAEMEGEKGPWLLENPGFGTPQGFWFNLGKRYATGTFNPTPPVNSVYDSRPEQAGKKVSEQWAFEFLPEIIRTFRIKLATQKATAREEEGTGETNRTVPAATMAEVAKRVEMKKLTKDEAAIGVTLTYAPEDLVGKNGEAVGAEGVELELLKVARDLLLQSRALKYGICRETSGDSNGVLERYLREGYILPPSRVGIFFDGGDFLVEAKDLNLLGGVGFNLTNSGSAADQEFIERLSRRESPKLKAQPNRIVSMADVGRDKAHLASLRPLTAEVEAATEGDELLFSVTRRLVRQTLTLSGTGSYSPEEQFLGQVEVTGENLARRDETYTLKLTGGTERQQGSFIFALPPGTPPQGAPPRVRFAGFRASVEHFRDKDELFGNPAAVKLKERTTSFGATLSFAFDSFRDKDHINRAQGIDKTRKRLQHQVRADLGFDYRDVLIRPKETLLPELTNGRQAAPELELSYLLSADTRRGEGAGVGQVNLFANAKAQKGLSILGGDFKYERHLLSVGGQVFFGFASPADAFLRYERGAGVGSRGTPLFEQFRLGGANFGRGLEEGEVIGRGLAYERTELGIGVLPLWGLLKRALPSSKPKGGGEEGREPDPPPIIGGIDLSAVYLKIFYDRARTFDTSSFSRVLNPAGGVNGYGAAFELRGMNVGGRRANLTIGYARSPQSRLHRRGVVVTGLSYDF